MNDGDIRYLFEYDRWATRRVLSVIDGLPEAVWGDTGVIGERGLGAILVHQLGAHQRWRHGLSGSDLSPVPEREPLPSPAGTRRGLGGRVGRARGVARRRSATTWLAELGDGVPYWQMLAHVVNHGTQHRSEAAAILLTDAGRSPGDLDMIFFAEELAAPSA